MDSFQENNTQPQEQSTDIYQDNADEFWQYISTKYGVCRFNIHDDPRNINEKGANTN